ncbi:MAG TPA: PTS sugar transporter subunit IIA [Thermoanaerobaculia bacterium]|nr:PTS sugar transporter subunit IIA [Thermoanaerobaculia bacterium]
MPELELIAGLIVSHGHLAHELLKAAETIEDNQRTLDGIEAVSLEWSDTVEQSREKIQQALGRFADYQGVIIFTDMFGGTPSNISLSFFEKDRVEIVTGVNLPMILKFASLQGHSGDLISVAHMIREKGSKSIRVASDLLATESVEPGA